MKWCNTYVCLYVRGWFCYIHFHSIVSYYAFKHFIFEWRRNGKREKHKFRSKAFYFYLFFFFCFTLCDNDIVVRPFTTTSKLSYRIGQCKQTYVMSIRSRAHQTIQNFRIIVHVCLKTTTTWRASLCSCFALLCCNCVINIFWW